MAKHSRMTDLKARTITEGKYHRDRGDGAARGLFVQVTQSVAKDAKPGEVMRSWVYRFVSPIHQRARWMGLGPIPVIGLAEARKKATEARKLVINGKDPIDEREKQLAAARVEAAKFKTFGDVAQEYIKENKDDWKNPKHAAQWEATFKNETMAINNLPIDAIDLPLVLRVLKPIWRDKPETASRVRGRMERVITYAIVSGYRSREKGNPAAWEGNLSEVLSSKSKAQQRKRKATGRSEHHKALPLAEVPMLMTRLRGNKSTSARALEFTILTAARTGATTGAHWDEIDEAAKVWIVPGTRQGTKMNVGREHRVPLSNRAMVILQELPRERGNDHVFIGTRPGRGLSDMAMLELVRGMIGGYTVHGFRSAFKDWADSRNYPDDLSELALAHKDKDKVRASYKRSDRLEDRRPMMESWARYCAAPAGEVVSLNERREAMAVS
jgi:integrase